MGPVFEFWVFKPIFSLSSFILIKRLFSSSLLSAIRVVTSVYLGLLIFHPAILIPACASSSPSISHDVLCYKLNKHGDNIQPWLTPFPVWNQSVVPCPVLTVASWSAYRFLRRQVLVWVTFKTFIFWSFRDILCTSIWFTTRFRLLAAGFYLVLGFNFVLRIIK